MGKRINLTIRYDKEQHDFSLPADVRIKELEDGLEELLPQVFSGLELDGRVFYLKNQKGLFSPEYTLSDYGVREGAVIELCLPEW